MPTPKIVCITTHAQACACALLNVRFDYPETRIPYDVALRTTRFSVSFTRRTRWDMLHRHEIDAIRARSQEQP